MTNATNPRSLANLNAARNGDAAALRSLLVWHHYNDRNGDWDNLIAAMDDRPFVSYEFPGDRALLQFEARKVQCTLYTCADPYGDEHGEIAIEIRNFTTLSDLEFYLCRLRRGSDAEIRESVNEALGMIESVRSEWIDPMPIASEIVDETIRNFVDNEITEDAAQSAFQVIAAALDLGCLAEEGFALECEQIEAAIRSLVSKVAK